MGLVSLQLMMPCWISQLQALLAAEMLNGCHLSDNT